MKPILLDFPHEFTTERLRVRCPLPGDGAMVNEAIRESQDELKVWEAYFVNLPSVEESEERARRAHAKFLLREDLRLYMFRKSSGRFVGSAGLHRINWDVGRGCRSAWAGVCGPKRPACSGRPGGRWFILPPTYTLSDEDLRN